MAYRLAGVYGVPDDVASPRQAALEVDRFTVRVRC